MEHLMDFVFITMGNLTLARCDAYLNHLKNGIKPDTLAALRTAPLQIATVFPDTVIKRVEEEIAHYDSKGQSSSYAHGKGQYHFCARAFPKERIKSAGCQYKDQKLKYVKSVSCITQLSYVKPVASVKNVASNLPVGARLQNFWKTWIKLGAGPKVVQILKQGYTLPFRIQPKLTMSPTVISCYVNPQRNLYLLKALHQLMDKNAVELVQNQTSLGFFNRLFLVPKFGTQTQQQVETHIRSEQTHLFLKAEKFKMETLETIRISLQPGEWVTLIDFKDAYFHIPIQEQSTKYLRFHVQGQTYQFKALLSVCPQHP